MIQMRVMASALIVALSLIAACEEPVEHETRVDLTNRVDRAEQLLSAGKAVEAGAIVDILLGQYSDDWRVHDLAARIHLQQGIRLRDDGLIEQSQAELLQAVSAYQKATALVPALAGLYTSAGNAAVMAGDKQQANVWYRDAIGLDAEDVRPP
ncbi:MAG: hypothetical protein HOJ54_09155, partial [Phycisphaerae bacterium]|nr:hypothetical protein [Phycisphaerae bacterium]